MTDDGTKPTKPTTRRRTPPPGVPAIPEVPSEAAPSDSSPSADSGVTITEAPAAASPPLAPPSEPARPVRAQASPAPQAASAPKAKDPNRAGRFLIVDVYSLSLGGKPNWAALASASDDTNEYVGAILKATEGAVFDTTWFEHHWKLVREAGGDRYGVDWFRGAYHYLKFNRGGVVQAEAYVRAIERAGGWARGDFYPIVDVELGNPANTNYTASAQLIVDVTSAFVNKAEATLGRKVILYGRGAMRDKRVASKMGCSLVWNPAYTPHMETNGLVTVGGKSGPWRVDDIGLWQYTDGREIALSGYPKSAAGFGACDHSVYVDGANKPTLSSLRARLLGI